MPKLVCHRDDHLPNKVTDYSFFSDFSVSNHDKQTKFKPSKIHLTTKVFQEVGLFFKSRTFIGLMDFNYFFALGERATMCGEPLQKSDLEKCSFQGGDDHSNSPEMNCIVSCDKWRFQMILNEKNELRINCTDPKGQQTLEPNSRTTSA